MQGKGAPGNAALKVTTRRGGGDPCWDGLWRGRGGSVKSKSRGRRQEGTPSTVPRVRGGDFRLDQALRRAARTRSPLRFPSRRQPVRPPARPRQLLWNAPQSTRQPAVRTPAATPRPPDSVRPSPQVTTPTAGGRRPPLTSRGSGNHFPRGKGKGGCRRVEGGRRGTAGSAENRGSVLRASTDGS